MSWECKLVDVELKHYNGADYPVGTMFYGPTQEEIEADSKREKFNGWFRLQALHLSEYYKANNSHRRPLFVILPDKILWCIDGCCWSNGEHYGGWTVTGEAPNITVQPSINIGGAYHGWLQNGVISDDCEGRKYDEVGHQIRTPNVPT